MNKSTWYHKSISLVSFGYQFGIIAGIIRWYQKPLIYRGFDTDTMILIPAILNLINIASYVGIINSAGYSTDHQVIGYKSLSVDGHQGVGHYPFLGPKKCRPNSGPFYTKKPKPV